MRSWQTALTCRISDHAEMNHTVLSILDVQIYISADCPEILAQLEHKFYRYIVQECTSNFLEMTVQREREGYRVSFEGRQFHFCHRNGWPQVDDLLEMVVTRQRQDLNFFHASCVNTPTGAVLLVGGTTSGKTTLALALQQIGYPMLCDDVSPVDLLRGHVLPLTTKIMLRESTARMVSTKGWSNDYVDGQSMPSLPISSLFLLKPREGLWTSRIPAQENLNVWAEMEELCYGRRFVSDSKSYNEICVYDERVFRTEPCLSVAKNAEPIRFLMKHMRRSLLPLGTLLSRMAQFQGKVHIYNLVPGWVNPTVASISAALCGEESR